jgi:tRNA (cmo5U34)-methyltransferase
MNIPHDWTFKNIEVADAFDRHVREQLPWYDLTTGVVAHFARHYIPEGGLVYDIGASTGNVGRALADTLKSRSARIVGIESAQEMADRYAAPGELVIADAASYDFKPFDLSVCFLVLMFLSPARRSELLRRLVERANPGGAILVFDKSQPVGGYPSVIMQRLALAGKVSAGVKAEEVIAKELSLAGAQRPLHVSELPAGAIEIFRFGDFAGWLIEKSYPTN